MWGGLYRNVWLLQTSPVHIDPTDYAAPGVYLTPKNVSADSADLDVRTLLRNTSASDAQAQVKARIIDPDGKEVTTLTGTTPIPAHGTAASELIDHDQAAAALGRAPRQALPRRDDRSREWPSRSTN